MPRAGNTATTAAVEGGQQPRPSNPIAALIRQGAQEAGRQQGSNRAVTKVQRMINSLQWRQAHSKDEFYPLTLGSGIELRLRQLQAGEVTGLGTGATVWPAAHVLAKYLELRYNGETGMRGLRVVDLGSGTGVAGIAAAALGAAETFLTDQEQLLFLMQENAERCTTPRTGANADTTDSAGTAGDCTAPAAVHVVTYDWGMNDDSLSPPVDVILVSDCVLPKLYPIEPLVDAIDKLSGPGTVTIMSYEHRHYQAFDPRRRFEELAAERGFYKSDIPQSQQHPIFSADDIEIWEVRRNGRPSEVAGDTGGADPVRSANAAALFPADGYVGGGVVISQCASNEVTGAVNELANTTAQVMMLGERHELSQSLSGAIGCYLWPSAVVMARHLVAAAAITSSTSNAAAGASLRPAQTTALELGSGVGLVAMAVALMGWDVVATDKADALPLLEANVKACLSSTERACGTAQVVEYDWGSDARELLARRTSLAPSVAATGSRGEWYDVVLCADCVYAKSSVQPLLSSLCQVCGENTTVLVTNELRSAFDEFLQAAREFFSVEDLPVSESDMVVDAATNQRPKPVSLKRLRRRQPRPRECPPLTL